jgi:WS/DGAT/MGAT family acyltransferase
MEENIMKQLTGADEMWFSLENPNTPMHITDIHIYDPSTAPGGRVTRKDILNYISQRLDNLFMREKRVPVPFGLDYSYWAEDEDFDLEYHVRHTKLPKPGDWRQLVAEAGRIVEAPLDMSRPLWEIHVIEGLNKVNGFPKGCFAIVHKKHHGQFDGGSATYLKSVMHTLEPDAFAESDPAEHSAPAGRTPSPYELLYRTTWTNMLKPMQQLSFFYRTLPNLPKAMNAVVTDKLKTPSHARTRFSGSIPSPQRVMEAMTVSMKDIKRLRKLVPGSTVNDVVITIFGGAVRKYLLHHQELPTKPLLGLIPISVRKEEEIADGGNKIFSMISDMHTEMDDPVERMANVHEATQYSKEFTDALGGRSMAEMLELAPLSIIDGGIKLASQMKVADYVTALDSGIGISNVPGSRKPMYFCGAKQITCFNWGFLMDGMGLLLVAGSYCDDLVLTAVSCPEMMPDPDFFIKCVQEAFDELNKA